MFCVNCGAEIPENGKFCPNCGAKADEIPQGNTDAAPNINMTAVKAAPPVGTGQIAPPVITPASPVNMPARGMMGEGNIPSQAAPIYAAAPQAAPSSGSVPPTSAPVTGSVPTQAPPVSMPPIPGASPQPQMPPKPQMPPMPGMPPQKAAPPQGAGKSGNKTGLIIAAIAGGIVLVVIIGIVLFLLLGKGGEVNEEIEGGQTCPKGYVICDESDYGISFVYPEKLIHSDESDGAYIKINDNAVLIITAVDGKASPDPYYKKYKKMVSENYNGAEFSDIKQARVKGKIVYLLRTTIKTEDGKRTIDRYLEPYKNKYVEYTVITAKAGEADKTVKDIIEKLIPTEGGYISDAGSPADTDAKEDNDDDGEW
ncbi:MAG TPA: hypothetical protein DCG85_08740 [Lachnospiraceae bacterium]|nr:hypothetical protein [Lachnospiraceae bacterium]